MTFQQQVNSIVAKKEEKYQQYQKKKNQVLQTLYKGFYDNEAYSKIAKKVKEISSFSKALQKNSLKVLHNLEKKRNAINKTPQEERSDYLYLLLLVRYNGANYLKKGMYDELNEQEANAKDDAINENIANARKSKNVFYIASFHEDCAEDHEEAQGRIYIDENWESYISDEDLKTRIKAFIKKWHIISFQKIITKPVYFITRPNCRHYFAIFDNEEVLKITNLMAFLKANGLYSKVGKRRYYQTLDNSQKNKWYNIENIIAIIKKYKERGETYTELLKSVESTELKRALMKNNLLLKKWRNELDKYLK